MCSLPSMLAPHLTETHADPMHAASLWVHNDPAWQCLEVLVALVSCIPSESYNLIAFSSTEFHEPWGEGFYGNITFRTKYSKVFHSLYTMWLWVTIYHRMKLLWWWLKKTLMYDCSIMLIGVILWLCSFSKMVGLGFYLDPWDNTLRYLLFPALLGIIISMSWNGP